MVSELGVVTNPHHIRSPTGLVFRWSRDKVVSTRAVIAGGRVDIRLRSPNTVH